MKQKIVILSILFFLFKIGYCQNYKVQLKTGYWSDTVSNPEIKPILELYKNYLESNPDSIYDNPYWNSREKELYHDFDFSRNSIFKGEGSWTPKVLYKLFKPQILKVEKRDSCYLIQSLLYWEGADSVWQKYNPIAITRVYAIKEHNEWKLANAIFIDTKNWLQNKARYVTYHFINQELFNDSLAKNADFFCDSLIKRFKFQQPKPIEFYIVKGGHEVGQLLGYDHYIYGYAEGKAINNVIISGSFKANYLHELVHQLMPKNSERNWLVNEGIPVWLAGSMGKVYKELAYEYAKDFLKVDSANFEWAMECHINCYPFFGLVIDLIHDKVGDEGLKHLMLAKTKTDEELYEAIFQLTGWRKEMLWEKFKTKVQNTANRL